MVGPNGSGKSNVIDAMLFVFGKRAKQVASLSLSLPSLLLPLSFPLCLSLHLVHRAVLLKLIAVGSSPFLLFTL